MAGWGGDAMSANNRRRRDGRRNGYGRAQECNHERGRVSSIDVPPTEGSQGSQNRPALGSRRRIIKSSSERSSICDASSDT